MPTYLSFARGARKFLRGLAGRGPRLEEPLLKARASPERESLGEDRFWVSVRIFGSLLWR